MVEESSPALLAIFTALLTSSGVVASDPQRPYKPAARVRDDWPDIANCRQQFRISLHSVRDPRDVRASRSHEPPVPE